MLGGHSKFHLLQDFLEVLHLIDGLTRGHLMWCESFLLICAATKSVLQHGCAFELPPHIIFVCDVVQGLLICLLCFHHIVSYNKDPISTILELPLHHIAIKVTQFH